jgi:hypothetical protein
MLSGANREAAGRVMQAMLKMGKIDIAGPLARLCGQAGRVGESIRTQVGDTGKKLHR